MRIRARRMVARPGPIPGRPDAPVTAGLLHGIPSLRARTLLPDPSGRIADRPIGPATAASPVPIPGPTRPARTGPLPAPPSTQLSRAHSRAVPTGAAGTWAGVRQAAVRPAAVTPAGPPLSPATGPAVTPAGPPLSPPTGPAVTPAGPPLSPPTGPAVTRTPAIGASAIGASVIQVPASRARAIGAGVYQTPTAGTCAPRPSGMPAGPARGPVTGTRPGWSRSSRSRSSHGSEGHGKADRGEPAQAAGGGLRRPGRRGGGANCRAGAGR
jgi:hypothetical protein